MTIALLQWEISRPTSLKKVLRKCATKPRYFYRPQTKFAKVMFLHMSVILSMGGCLGPYPGGGWGSGWGGLQAHTRGVSRPRPKGSPDPGLGGCVSQHALRQTPPPPADGYCGGRYASYWNAFLFIFSTRTPLLCYDDLYVTVIEKLYINHIVYFFYNVV